VRPGIKKAAKTDFGKAKHRNGRRACGLGVENGEQTTVAIPVC
jgi:hypothetical protein